MQLCIRTLCLVQHTLCPCVLVKILHCSYDGWVSNIVVDVVIGSVTVLV
jgi:hypothetical protein